MGEVRSPLVVRAASSELTEDNQGSAQGILDLFGQSTLANATMSVPKALDTGDASGEGLTTVRVVAE
jgi:hypothetical protein